MSIEVSPEHKGPDAVYIKNLFSSISQTYDKANDVITLGIARGWRKELVRYSGAPENAKVLDCATGTGDLALDFKRILGPSAEVIGSDFCAEMIALAPLKAKAQNLNVKFELGDAMALNYPSGYFDVTSIAYGIRNVSDVRLAVREMARVTKSQGKVMILETGEVRNPLLKSAIQLYFKRIVPQLGGWVSGQKEAYEYLQSSSARFPSGPAFCDLLKSTQSFYRVDFKPLLGGASYIYRCVVK